MSSLIARPLRETAAARSRDDLVCVIAEDALSDVLQLMAQRRIGAVVVIDESGRTAGIFTERDLLMKAVDLQALPLDVKVGELMTRGVVSVQGDTTVAEAADLMLDCGFRHLIINDRSGCPDGIVSIRDLFKVLRRAAEGETRP